jgi:RimJ/RimL family protein N-acetyltransferase
VHTFAVREEASGKLLGGCQLRKLANGSAEVSYWTSAPHRGHKVAQRALRLLCRHARHEGIGHLEAHVSVDNPASQAVAIAVGFTAQGRCYDGVNLMIRFVLDQTFSRGNA